MELCNLGRCGLIEAEFVPPGLRYSLGLRPHLPLSSGLLNSKYPRSSELPGRQAPDKRATPRRGPPIRMNSRPGRTV